MSIVRTIQPRLNKAMYFNGVNTYVALSYQPPLSNGFTFITWAMLPTYSPYYLSLFNNNQFFIRRSNAVEGNYWDSFVKLSDGSVEPRARGVPASYNTWYHLTASWDKNYLRMYVNASLTQSIYRSGSLTSTTVEARIGMGEQTCVTCNPYLGYIALVLIYSRALSGSEIQWNYNNPNNPVRDGLVLWLDARACDTSKNICWDLSGNGNHGTMYNVSIVTFPNQIYPGMVM